MLRFKQKTLTQMRNKHWIVSFPLKHVKNKIYATSLHSYGYKWTTIVSIFLILYLYMPPVFNTLTHPWFSSPSSIPGYPLFPPMPNLPKPRFTPSRCLPTASGLGSVLITLPSLSSPVTSDFHVYSAGGFPHRSPFASPVTSDTADHLLSELFPRPPRFQIK